MIHDWRANEKKRSKRADEEKYESNLVAISIIKIINR